MHNSKNQQNWYFQNDNGQTLFLDIMEDTGEIWYENLVSQ